MRIYANYQEGIILKILRDELKCSCVSLMSANPPSAKSWAFRLCMRDNMCSWICWSCSISIPLSYWTSSSELADPHNHLLSIDSLVSKIYCRSIQKSVWQKVEQSNRHWRTRCVKILSWMQLEYHSISTYYFLLHIEKIHRSLYFYKRFTLRFSRCPWLAKAHC